MSIEDIISSVYTFPRMRPGDNLNPFTVHCSNEFKSYYACVLSRGMRVPRLNGPQKPTSRRSSGICNGPIAIYPLILSLRNLI